MITLFHAQSLGLIKDNHDLQYEHQALRIFGVHSAHKVVMTATFHQPLDVLQDLPNSPLSSQLSIGDGIQLLKNACEPTMHCPLFGLVMSVADPVAGPRVNQATFVPNPYQAKKSNRLLYVALATYMTDPMPGPFSIPNKGSHL
jgi:hypothetical protein